MSVATDLVEQQIDQILANTDKAELSSLLLQAQGLWIPLVGSPQRQAWDSQADVVLFGGAAGGGKSDLAIGLMLTQHQRTLYIRKEGKQLQPVYDRLTELLGHREGFNSQSGIWRLPDQRQGQFGGVLKPGDETSYQGNARDLLVLDEVANIPEFQARFLMGWVRSTDPNQRCRVLMCSNPPTDPDGEWLIEYFAPWLKANHPRKAEPGELRWFASVAGKDMEVPDNKSFVWDPSSKMRVYNYPPSTPVLEIITPQSRTFIPSKISDNPFLMDTGYKSTLQALPEPLRSQMLYGDFLAGREDGARQVIPSSWVERAMERWEEKRHPGVMKSMGVDVSRGGRDPSIIATLYEDDYFAALLEYPGHSVPDGPTLGTEVLLTRRDGAPVHVDAIGVGTSVVDFLVAQDIQVHPHTGSERCEGRDSTGVFRFKNMRAYIYWMLRQALDPQNRNHWIALPRDDMLKADLCAPTFKLLDGNVIKMLPKDELIKLLGRSPDKGDGVTMAWIQTPKRVEMAGALYDEEFQYADRSPVGGY